MRAFESRKVPRNRASSIDGRFHNIIFGCCKILFAGIPYAHALMPPLYAPVPHAPNCNDFFQKKFYENVLKHDKKQIPQKEFSKTVLKHSKIARCSKHVKKQTW